jgi:sugar lactone lactonase YvrE
MTIAPPRPELSDLKIRALFEEARRRRQRRRMMAGATIAATLGLVVGLLVSVSPPTRGDRGFALSPQPNRVGTFAHPTGVVLVFADGLTLDLDHRLAVARAIPGQRAGDQRWDIIRSGDSFVVGWGEVWASPIDGGPPRLLGPVVTYIPAAEPGAVWLVDYPGGRIGEGTPTLREVTVTGSVLRTELGPPPSSGVPIVGIPGGLAFQSSTGIALWNVDRGAFTRRLGNEAGFIGNASAGYIAWCEGICTSLHLTVVNGADHTVPSPQPSKVLQPDSIRLSPDGRYVAVITTREGLGTADQRGTLDVIDTRTGRVDVVRRQLSAWSTLAWRPDSRTVFFASDNSSGMTVGEFQVGTGHQESADVPTQNAEPFVIVKRSEATALLSGAVQGPMSACPASAIGSDPPRACAYSY